MSKSLTERNNYMKELRSRRMTYREIGGLFGLTKERAWEICNDIIKRDYRASKWKPGAYSRLPLNKLRGRDNLRERVRIRDNHTCQSCLKIWEPGTRRFDVHHLDPNEEGKTGKTYNKNLDMRKMITLCKRCHSRLEHLRSRASSGAMERWHGEVRAAA